MADVLGGIAVLVGGIVLYFFDWPAIDPILSIGITIYVLYNVVKNLRHSMTILLQGTPTNINLDEVQSRILALPEIQSIHDLHSWTRDGTYNVLTLHAVISENLPLEQTETIKSKIRELMADLAVQHVTVELEVPGYACEHEACSNPNSD